MIPVTRSATLAFKDFAQLLTGPTTMTDDEIARWAEESRAASIRRRRQARYDWAGELFVAVLIFLAVVYLVR